jgi:hypothetical protein
MEGTKCPDPLDSRALVYASPRRHRGPSDVGLGATQIAGPSPSGQFEAGWTPPLRPTEPIGRAQTAELSDAYPGAAAAPIELVNSSSSGRVSAGCTEHVTLSYPMRNVSGTHLESEHLRKRQRSMVTPPQGSRWTLRGAPYNRRSQPEIMLHLRPSHVHYSDSLPRLVSELLLQSPLLADYLRHYRPIAHGC